MFAPLRYHGLYFAQLRCDSEDPVDDEPVDDWTRVADAVKARLIEKRVWGNLAEIARDSKVSDATWRNLLRGQPVSRADRLILIADYLGWTWPDFIAEASAGRPPTPRTPPRDGRDGRDGETIDQVRRELDRIRSDVGRLGDEIGGVREMVTQIERHLNPPPRNRRSAAPGA